MSDESRVEKNKQSIITVERTAWVAVGLLAAALRLFQLGMRPLTESEAVQALAAYRFTTGAASVAPAGSIPALFTGNTVSFSLVGAGDASARWLPAIAGLILVLLPYWLRHRLGRGGALAAAILLAVSPSAVYFSRMLDGATVVAVCGLAVAIGLINYVDSHQAGPLYLMATALGLGLTAGPGTLTLLLIFAAFGLVLYLNDRLLGRQAGWSSLAVAWWALRGETRLLARAAVVLAATFGLAATALVLHPAGLGHAADLIGAWVQGFLPESGGRPVIYPLLLLLRYEPLILLLGLVEAGWVVLGRQTDPEWEPRPKLSKQSAFPHTAFLAFWAVAAAIVIVVSGHRPASNLMLVVAPLALLAGQGIERAWRWLTNRELWPRALLVAAVALSLLIFFYLQVASYGQASSGAVINIGGLSLYTTSTYLILASVALLLLIALGAAAWIWHGPELVVAGTWMTAVIALGLFGLKATWGLGFAHAVDREAEFIRELMVLQATTQDVRDVVAELETLSRAETGDAHTMPITIDEMTGPVVRWYLREFKSQTIVNGLTDRPDTMAAVTLTMHEPAIGETFRGQSFPLRAHWLPWGRWGQELVRWLLLGGSRSDQPVVDQEVVLWVARDP